MKFPHISRLRPAPSVAMSSSLLATPALLSLRPRAPAGLRAKAAGLRVAAPVARRSVVVASAAAPAVGTLSYGGNGKVGAATFAGTKTKGPNFKVIAAVGIGLPTLGAIATALAAPVADLSFSAAPLKGPLLVTFLATVMYFYTVMQTTSARGRFKVRAPATIGVSEDFDRYLRAQMNTLEQLAIFFPTLWLAALLVSPTAATVAGMGWVIGRVLYARGYYKDAASRGPGFGVSFFNQLFLMVLAGIGALRTLIA